MSILITLLAFALAIGVLVTVHEYGHYWVAKRCGVKVLTFSIGFGKPLLRWQRGETQWQLAAIPLGGYVRMLDEREAPVPVAELDRAFNRQTVGKRMAIVVAGPVANFLLAIFVYWAIFLNGVDVLMPKLGSIEPHSLAAKAGFSVGDTIVAIDQESINSWAEARLGLIERAAAKASVQVEVLRPNGAAVSRTLDFAEIDNEWIDGELAGRIGMSIAVYRNEIGPLLPDGAAAAAGLKQGDKIWKVEDKPTPDWPSFTAAVRARPNLPTRVSVLRAGQPLEFQVLPKSVQEGDQTIGRIGAAPVLDMDAMHALSKSMQYGVVSALGQALHQTWATSSLSLKMMWRMVLGNVSVKQLSGPVAIAGYAGKSAQYGLRAYLEFLCLISISLGVMNLLPVPVLDGGHLMYYFAEILRGRPLSERAMELGQRVGVGLLAALMVVAVFNDLTRLVGG
ncbi:RIP metalloprotease RseP [Chitinimonas sp. BJB300]|uniref:RIP metalloprotease RseP n=1 Tax=Chitinimonas sp. BJB300 TaxID=1559339 RepID=UPI000C119E70|nr:RIP metalloprotease RseP [Chitinimonas sp. BJB300]PHV13124.1 RIP metalloprotease RseP [Chitinimonas sp. BJB300]TSJ84721.1 RIP metalloprotease RseP [Chitinimonas sp. BJB300]